MKRVWFFLLLLCVGCGTPTTQDGSVDTDGGGTESGTVVETGEQDSGVVSEPTGEVVAEPAQEPAGPEPAKGPGQGGTLTS